jgi:hypothetical protein
MSKKKSKPPGAPKTESELTLLNRKWRETRQRKFEDARKFHDADGKFSSGPSNPNYRLSKRVVGKVILRRMKFNESFRAIGRRYVISHTMVSKICAGEHRYSDLNIPPEVLLELLAEIVEENNA